ncbi:hypothetical protein EML15_08145 [Corynebacterium sp. sy017]|uniref:hypothetical protein n=1 Tax=unclassified Corynebacterium TaxID=2624378 RepID=UPI001185E2CF|nr:MULTISPECIES: hypothetical protein [unclassified Corynebacterium]MBP3089114.1 hypothetical protein [Corynebacterium sp. sy017]TSD91428.1 hypothetical protein ELY17_08155 [Corynebacterium sp. SY003]
MQDNDFLLTAIHKRIATYGEHRARVSAQRARQFIPFNALAGFYEQAKSKEASSEHFIELSDEQARYLSQFITTLTKGDEILLTYYAPQTQSNQNKYVSIRDTIVEVIIPLQIIRLAEHTIPFHLIKEMHLINGT